MSHPILYDRFVFMKVYSVDTRPAGHAAALLAAAGHQGWCSVLPLDRLGAEEPTPLLTWRAHRSWIGEVQFCSAGASERTLLLSASNDKSIALWDLNKSASSGRAAQLATVSPHSQGIFAMSERGGRVLSASKDGVVALSELTGDALRVVRQWDELHERVVKSVRWRSTHLFASAGNDAHIAIVDVRQAGGRPATLISDAHESAINSITWSPSDEHMVHTHTLPPLLAPTHPPGTPPPPRAPPMTPP